MFDPGSRYYKLPNLIFTTSDNRHVAYKSRRFLPQPTDLTFMKQWQVVENDRLDLIAFQQLGDALASWQVADANCAMHPKSLTETPGTILKIAVPEDS